METAEISLAMLIPGFMHAAINRCIILDRPRSNITCWLYTESYPAMYWAMKRGQQTVGNTI